jgi:anti-anti-sigma factor
LESNFAVDVTEQARGTVVTISGELDVASSRTLEHELAKLHGVSSVVIDLRELSFIDSTGLGVLVKAHQLAKQQGGRVALVRGNGQVDRLMGLTGLEAELLMGDSPEQLLAG